MPLTFRFMFSLWGLIASASMLTANAVVVWTGFLDVDPDRIIVSSLAAAPVAAVCCIVARRYYPG